MSPSMSPALSSPAGELLRDPAYARLKQYLIETTGLAYYADKDEDLARRIGRRLSSFGPGFGLNGCASYLDRLREPGAGQAEMDSLIAEITIGETYFFRHQEHFDALRDIVLPDIIERNASSRRLRIWCAGCSGGAEPYSLSILLRRELANLLIGWDVSILGTDINRQGLTAARAGQFQEWDLRATSPELRRACFRENGEYWTIAPEYKSGVSFQFHNLVAGTSPPLPGGCSPFDLIVCRNVMIYFGADLMRRVVGQFHDSLASGAWLLVGPSEPNMTYFTSFRPVNAPGVTLYQKPAAADPEPREIPAFADAATLPHPAFQMGAKPACTGPVPTLDGLRKMADQGDWAGAAGCGRELIQADSLNAQVHFHYALVMRQMENQAEAERSFRRAIYLDRRAVLAHYHLGLLLESRDERRQAMRCFENALDLLAARDGAAPLPDADGLTAAELSKLARTKAEILRGEAEREKP